MSRLLLLYGLRLLLLYGLRLLLLYRLRPSPGCSCLNESDPTTCCCCFTNTDYRIQATAVYQAKEKLKSIDKARKGSISSEEIIKYAHRISASNAVCAPLNWVPGDPRRPYPTDLEMRSGMLGHMANMPTNGVNGHLPGDALAAGRLPDVLTPHYPWQSSDVSVGMLPPHHGNDFGLEPPGHNKENEDDVEAMSTDSSSSSSDSD